MATRKKRVGRAPRRGQEPHSGETRSTSASGETVTIRKYENRRLYDTSSSRYINIDRVAEMVREGLDVRVVEAKTDRDVTRQVLTQIIVDSARSKDGPPLEFLRDLVRAGDRANRDFLQWYLGGAAEVYQMVREGWEAAYRNSPAGRLQQRMGRFWMPESVEKTLSQLLDKGRWAEHASRAVGGAHEEAFDEADEADEVGEQADEDEAEDWEGEAEETADGAEADLAELRALRERLERLEERLDS